MNDVTHDVRNLLFADILRLLITNNIIFGTLLSIFRLVHRATVCVNHEKVLKDLN